MDKPGDAGGDEYREAMRPGMLSMEQVAERLACAPAEALALVRRVGPRGVVRTNDRRLWVPSAALDELRDATRSPAAPAHPFAG